MSSAHTGLRMAPSLLKEESSGELVLQTGPLKSIDSLILFDRPKCSLRTEDVALLMSASSSTAVDDGAELEDLDSRIRERLSEYSCSCCSCPLPGLHYQSQKEADIIICSNCFHDGKFIIGHSSVDFLRVDSKKDTIDFDGDNWTDQETLLLLEAVEKYNDSWNEIAEHVGTKSKAQCILHFLRLPMEDGLLERLEIPQISVSSDCSNEQYRELSCSNSNGDAAGFGLESFDLAKQLPFADSPNPVMSLVAFLASAVGPRVAAACASTALSVLTKGDSRLNSESIRKEVGSYEAHASHIKDETPEDQVSYTKKDAPLTIEHVKLAAMSGLSAAAMKSKLFADQEEREVQRLSATIITHQLKRLELKLKQFAEVETLLMKECDQVDRNRQRLAAERVRMMSSRFVGQTGALVPAASGVASASPSSSSTRQTIMPSSSGQAASMPPAYGNNLPVHQQMSFVQRQQQMFGYGPRLPLSAIHPSPSGPAPASAPASTPNVIFGSGMPNTSTSNHQRLLRSASTGNSTNIG